MERSRGREYNRDDTDVVIYSQQSLPVRLEHGGERIPVIAASQLRPSWKPHTITIEPVIFLFSFAAALQDPTINALVYKKVCHENFNGNICQLLHHSNRTSEEDIVQSQSSYWILYHNLCYEIPAILLALLYGSFSDNISRRAAIALPCVGQMLCGVSFIFNSYYMSSPIGYTLIGQVVSGFTGGWIACFMALFSYLGEATAENKRTQRVMIAEGVAAIGTAISLASSGVLLDNTNYITVFALAATLNMAAAVYCFMCLKEPPKAAHQQLKGNWCVAFAYKFKDTISCVFKERENNGRARLLVSLLVVLTGMISFNCIYKVGYLFVRRQPLSWSQTMYGLFAAMLQFIPGIAMLFIIPCMKQVLHMKDTTLIMIGIASSAVSEFYLSFCTVTWMVWIMPFLAFLKGGTWVVRSLVSKLVDPPELGGMYAALGALQSISGMIGAVIYNTIYPKTLDFWPGFCFTLGAFMCMIPLSLTLWLHCDSKKNVEYETLAENTTIQTNNIESTDKQQNMAGTTHYGFSLFI